jgi:hypothetical protein
MQTTLCGPKIGDYQIRDAFPLEAQIWSTCGAQRALIINSSVRLVKNSDIFNARGLMTTDSINGKVTHIYGLQWRRCVL